LGFLPTLSARSWKFSVAVARVMYLWPSWDDADLYLTDLSARDPQRLTRTPYGVIDYIVDKQGANVFYAALRQDGGSDLRILNLPSGEDRLQYACPELSRCQALALHPNGSYLAFERHEYAVGAAGKPIAGPPEVWVLPLGSDVEAFSIAGQDYSTSQPLFSPDGWLAYYDERLRAVALLEEISETARPVNFIPNDLGLLGSWSPDGSGLALVGMLLSDGQGGPGEAVYRSHIYLVQVRSGYTIDLSGVSEDLVEDASPTYAPSGDWIAFSRRSLQEERWTLGRQLWLMQPDGSQASALTDSPSYNHASMNWSPNSRHLVFLRKNQSDLAKPPELWWLDVESGEGGRLVEGGYLPYWMP
jgi:Tol biopolymer transport system component